MPLLRREGVCSGMTTETGVMVMKNGFAWGCIYSDGQSTQEGWMEPEKAPIYDPKYLILPTDVTYPGSHYTQELASAHVVPVIRTTIVQVLK